MNNKGSIMGFGIVVGLIVFLLVSASLIFITTRVGNSVEGSKTVPQCAFSAGGRDVVRNPFAFFSEGYLVDWNCPIDGPRKLTINDLKAPFPKNLPESTKDFYEAQARGAGLTPFEGQHLYEYNVNRIFANELKNCFLKTGFGNMDIFKGHYQKFNSLELVETAIGGMSGIVKTQISSTNKGAGTYTLAGLSKAELVQRKKLPTVCAYCSELYFDEDAIRALGNIASVQGIQEYMKLHPHSPQSPQSYWDFLEYEVNGLENTLVPVGTIEQTTMVLFSVYTPTFKIQKIISGQEQPEAKFLILPNDIRRDYCAIPANGYSGDSLLDD